MNENVIQLDQSDYEEIVENVPSVFNLNEAHVPILLLLDTSDSVDEYMKELCDAVNTCIKNAAQDETLKDVMEVAIIEFNSSWNLIQDFKPVTETAEIHLSAGGLTKMDTAIKVAVDKVINRGKFLSHAGVAPFVPWIIMITDRIFY